MTKLEELREYTQQKIYALEMHFEYICGRVDDEAVARYRVYNEILNLIKE
jgi:hypothetical protein